MGAVEELFKELKEYFDAEGIKYTVLLESDNLMKLLFAPRQYEQGRGLDTEVYIDFDERAEADGSITTHFASLSAGTCNDEKRIAEGLIAINALNKRFRWVKFWFDDSDNTINADADAILFPGTAGKECWQYANRMSRIVEKALMELREIFTPNNPGDPTGNLTDEERRRLFEFLSSMFG